MSSSICELFLDSGDAAGKQNSDCLGVNCSACRFQEQLRVIEAG